MTTSPESLFLTKKQIEKVIREVTASLTMNLSPDDGVFVVMLDKELEFYAKILPPESFKSIREGTWEVFLYTSDYEDGHMPAKTVKGPSLLNLLGILAEKMSAKDHFPCQVETDIGTLLLTTYQRSRIREFHRASTEGDFDGYIKIVAKMSLGETDKLEKASLGLDSRYPDELLLTFGTQEADVPTEDITQED